MEERIWKRPQLVPMPTVVNDMNDPVYCLNGSDWKLSLCPSESYYKKEDGDTAWESTTIPMQLSRNDKEYAYA